MKNKQLDNLLSRHSKLTHSEGLKVTSHVQREQGDWIINTLMIKGIDVPFKYKRKTRYKSLAGQKVNLTYYPDKEEIAGFDIEIMTIVRIKTF